MDNVLEIIKGLHPGFYLEREFRKRKIAQGKFAISIGEYPQTLSAILKGKRRMNVALSLKIEKELDLPEGLLMTLQVYNDIREEQRAENMKHKPNLNIFHRVLFWDTDFDKIDWIRSKDAVIRRVFERGTKEERAETIRFYGKEAVDKVLNEQ